MINASSLALLNAGSIPMRGVVCAIAVGKTRHGDLVADPDERTAIEIVQGGCFAFMVADGAGLESNSTTVWTNWKSQELGTFDENDLISAREVARESIKEVYATMKSSFLPNDDKMDI
jgi:exosome complex component RRP46